MNWPRILASTARPSLKDSRAWASSSNPRRQRSRPRWCGVSRSRSRGRRRVAGPPTPNQAPGQGSTADRSCRLRDRVPMSTARRLREPRRRFPVPSPTPRQMSRPFRDAVPTRRMNRIRVPVTRTPIARTSMNVVRVRSPRAVLVRPISARTPAVRLRPRARLVLAPLRAPRGPRRGPIRLRDHAPGTIPSAANRGCMCPRRAISPGRIRWHDPRSNAVAGVPDREDGQGSALVRVRPRRVVQDNGDSIAARRAPVPGPAPVPGAREAGASEAASRRGRRRRTVLPAAAAAERQAPSGARAASPRAPGRTGFRRDATSRRSRLPSSEG